MAIQEFIVIPSLQKLGYLLTPWCKKYFENLKVTQVVKE